MNENIHVSIKIPLKFVSKGQINNIPTLVQIMAWRRPGGEPLSEPLMTQLTDAYMRHSASMCKQIRNVLDLNRYSSGSWLIVMSVSAMLSYFFRFKIDWQPVNISGFIFHQNSVVENIYGSSSLSYG